MAVGEIISFIGAAAASGVIGSRADTLVTSLAPVQRLHAWLRDRRVDPASVEPSPHLTNWVNSLAAVEQLQLRDLLEGAVNTVNLNNVHGSDGSAVGNTVYGGTVIGTQNLYGHSDQNAGWEYAKIDHCQEGDFDNPGRMQWNAYISWPGRERLDVRDRVRIEQLLNELGKDGWELMSQQSNSGINGTDYFLRRRVRAR
ncbi:hypothetical protein OHA72_14975 [Dactylosporangium sp. NBC_01737]|uniref:hypothetical protein n=1 Tax=Dactylosporangium sp. NBC_01737 TaxID=2975959 RepID=UPI002E13414B|nr:hypothetical protein OHA72_14975 [Dactylosporangium sp. NBC_01737]